MPAGYEHEYWPTCIWDQILSLKVTDVEHGTRFQYRSIETDVLAHAMERVTGQRLPEIVSKRLWGPLGAEEQANLTVDSTGYGLPCGGFSASLCDFAHLGLASLNDGKMTDQQVIPKA